MSLTVAFAFTACSSDDDATPNYRTLPSPVERGTLTLSTDTVEVGVGETATFNITEGGGDYKLINERATISELSFVRYTRPCFSVPMK